MSADVEGPLENSNVDTACHLLREALDTLRGDPQFSGDTSDILRVYQNLRRKQREAGPR